MESMSRLVKCKTNHDQVSNNAVLLRSDRSYSRVATITKNKSTTTSTEHIYKAGEKRKRKEVTFVRKKHCDVTYEFGTDDIIMEIMLRVPWSTISRFKTVCKRWLEFLSNPVFMARYLNKNPFLLGFSYEEIDENQQILTKAKFVSLAPAVNCCPQYCDSLKNNIEASTTQMYYFRCLPKSSEKKLKQKLYQAKDLNLCSCNGILLRLHARESSVIMSLHNPFSGQSVFLPRPPLVKLCNTEVISYGLAINISSGQSPLLEAVEVIKTVRNCLQVNTFSSKSCSWESKVHNPEPFLIGDYCLSRRGISLHGVIYWLVTPSGVLAYSVESNSFSFDLLNIPGDPVGYKCFCRYKKPFNCAEADSMICRCTCMCRYLGHSQGRLCYIRVIGESEILMWVVDSGKWSHARRFMLHGLPGPLSYGRIVSVDPQDCHVLHIRIKSKIYSYHVELHELKEIHTIVLKNTDRDSYVDGEYGSITPIFHYEAPALPPSLAAQSCFDSIFGGSLCRKDTCWGDVHMNVMICPDAHLHALTDSSVHCDVAPGNERQNWLESFIADDDRIHTESYAWESEYVTIL